MIATATLARMAAAAYRESPSGITAQGYAGLGPLEYTRRKVDAPDAPRVVVWSAKNIAVIAVAGTKGIAEWRRNARTRLVQWGPLRMHAGFAADAEALLPHVRESISDIDPQVRIYVGHSAGGAIAAAIASFTEARGSCWRVVTFGAPRWCDRNTARQMQGADILGYINRGDMVPHVPMPFRYRRVGRVRWRSPWSTWWDYNPISISAVWAPIGLALTRGLSHSAERYAELPYK